MQQISFLIRKCYSPKNDNLCVPGGPIYFSCTSKTIKSVSVMRNCKSAMRNCKSVIRSVMQPSPEKNAPTPQTQT